MTVAAATNEAVSILAPVPSEAIAPGLALGSSAILG
jgi:hypothetical protein